MKPFQRAEIPKEEIERNAEDYRRQWEKDKFKAATGRECTKEALDRAIMTMIIDAAASEVYLNDLYQVILKKHESNGLVELSIRRRDRRTIHDWRELQEIKNMLVGPEHEGMEIYPAESRKVDTANQYYLWVVADPEYRFPFGFDQRSVSDVNLGKSKNRPFNETTQPGGGSPDIPHQP